MYKLRGMRLWSFDTFGLVARQVAVGPSATITVHPVPLLVDVADDVLRGRRDADEGQSVPRLVTAGGDTSGDFSGLRPYVPGDRLRLLYWPALARSGELMVRDFEDAGLPRVQVVADVRPLVGELGSERVLATVAGVGLQVLAHGSVLELSTTAGERVALGPGPLGPVSLLRAIASFEVPHASAARWWRRHHGTRLVPLGRGTEGRPMSGNALVVTTADGVRALPGTLGFAHVVLAPAP